MPNYSKEKAITKYKIAINKNASESEILWNRFNALLLFNSILISAIGLSYRSDVNLPLLIIIFLPIAGLISCYLWFITTLRGFQWIKYWITSARKIEEKYLSEKEGETSELDPVTKGYEYREEIIGWPRTETASYILILTVGIFYLIFLFYSFQPMIHLPLQ